MAVAWLSRLPLPQIKSSTSKESDQVARDDVEAGPPRFGLVADQGFAEFSVTWSFDELENRLFDGFWLHELVRGSLSFDMDLKVGAGLLSHECFFNGSPKTSLQGKRFLVKAKLLVVNKQYDTLSDYNDLKAANP